MFTGIIEATAKVTANQSIKDGLKLNFETPKNWNDIKLGESIAVNGICLTVSDIKNKEWTAVLMPETLARTSFGTKIPETVNLERALSIGDRLGGHLVQGHVDEIGKVTKVNTSAGYRIDIQFKPSNMPLVIEKGSIVIDGISLTVASVENSVLTVALIPHTLATTTIGRLKVGDLVNLEFDMIGKYIINNLNQGLYAKS